MMPASDSTGATPKRQSCDRCHGQKLRCTRSGSSSSSPCNRCLRQGVQCISSCSLPKGRPSICRSGVRRNSRRRSFTAISDVDADSGFHEKITAGDSILTDPVDAFMWQWPAPVSLDWNDMDIGPGLGDLLQELPTHLQPTGISHPGGVLPGDLLPGDGLELGQSGSISQGFEKSSSSTAIEKLSQLNISLTQLLHSSCLLAETAGLLGCNDSPESGSNGSQTRRGPLIDDASFQSVTMWLVHISGHRSLPVPVLDRREHGIRRGSNATSTGETLHGAFSAAHDLLEILRNLQGEGEEARSLYNTHAQMELSTTGIITTQPPSDSNESSSSYFSPENPASRQYSDTAARHLVVVCHSLLLNIYISVFIALRHDVDLWNPDHLPANRTEDTHAAETALEALADIRPVMVVQLCSYLIERQHQAVSAYMAPSRSLSSSSILNDLEVEVQWRLSHLRQVLRI